MFQGLRRYIVPAHYIKVLLLISISGSHCLAKFFSCLQFYLYRVSAIKHEADMLHGKTHHMAVGNICRRSYICSCLVVNEINEFILVAFS